MNITILPLLGRGYVVAAAICLASHCFAAPSFEPVELNTRSTAYTHTEADHLVWGKKTAIGTNLRFTTEYTSAAADWSYLPVGTEFFIIGMNRRFVVDDYGGALVGRRTVDLYFPTKREMNAWGLRYVNIVITKMGDFEKSRKILAQRSGWRHCRRMLTAIDKRKDDFIPGTEQPERTTTMFASNESDSGDQFDNSLFFADSDISNPLIDPMEPYGPHLADTDEAISDETINTISPEPQLDNSELAIDDLPVFAEVKFSNYPAQPTPAPWSNARKSALLLGRKEKSRFERAQVRGVAAPDRIERVIDPVC